MMMVIGEEGTSSEDYIIYQKGELLDSAYLQQNSFDPVDAACEPERQVKEFNVMYDILTQNYNLVEKNEIRKFFNELRQMLLDWHTIGFEAQEFSAKEEEIISLDALIYYLDEKLNASDGCDCGCEDDCSCDETCGCGCQEGYECTCDDKCHCGDECHCGGNCDDECHCGGSCNCVDCDCDNNCSCGCGCDETCDCGCQEGKECTCEHECHCSDGCSCHKK